MANFSSSSNVESKILYRPNFTGNEQNGNIKTRKRGAKVKDAGQHCFG